MNLGRSAFGAMAVSPQMQANPLYYLAIVNPSQEWSRIFFFP
jgi:hypothetical protein